jgi:hypothetical protein
VVDEVAGATCLGPVKDLEVFVGDKGAALDRIEERLKLGIDFRSVILAQYVFDNNGA